MDEKGGEDGKEEEIKVGMMETMLMMLGGGGGGEGG